jgi:predicted transcriptional regulator
MKKRILKRALVLLSVWVLALAVAAPALANQPAQRFTEDVTGDVFVCEDAVYTITSGEIRA